MARETCAECGGPREPGSSSYSYCIECSRAKQRKRYRDSRTAAGYDVRPRVEDASKERRRQLMDDQDKPGRCEACSQNEPDGLVLQTTSAYEDDMIGNPFALYCRDCDAVTHKLTTSELLRASIVLQHLAKTKVQHGNLVHPFIPPTAEQYQEQRAYEAFKAQQAQP